MFRRLGVSSVTELRLPHRATADSQAALDVLRQATGVLFSGGDQSRIRGLVGSKVNALLRKRFGAGRARHRRYERGRHRDGPAG